jgi:hypothetical protein
MKYGRRFASPPQNFLLPRSNPELSASRKLPNPFVAGRPHFH